MVKRNVCLVIDMGIVNVYSNPTYFASGLLFCIQPGSLPKLQDVSPSLPILTLFFDSCCVIGGFTLLKGAMMQT